MDHSVVKSETGLDAGDVAGSSCVDAIFSSSTAQAVTVADPVQRCGKLIRRPE